MCMRIIDKPKIPIYISIASKPASKPAAIAIDMLSSWLESIIFSSILGFPEAAGSGPSQDLQVRV